MTDILDQEGITFSSSNMASTHPTDTPAAITAPKIDMGDAPANQTIPTMNASELQAPVPKGGRIPSPPDPQQLSQVGSSAAGKEGSAPAGAAPPQPEADILDQEGITAQGERAYSAFNRGVSVSPGAQQTPETAPVVQYAADQAQHDYNLGQQRFTPAQMASFANNPRSITEAIQDQQDWPDVPALLQKVNAGEKLDSNQTNRLNDYIDTSLANNMRGMSWGGNKALTGTPLPAAAQSYVTQGKSGPTASTEPAVAPTYLSNNAIVPTPYTPGPGEKPLNAYMAVTDKGQQLMQQAPEKPATTAMKMMTFDELPSNLKKAFYDSLVIHDPNAKISDLQTEQGYTKAIDALGEQQAAQLIHWYTPMSQEEHEAAPWHGEMLPLAEDQAGKVRFDPRAGLLAVQNSAEQVVEGKAPAGSEEATTGARDVATFAAMTEFGHEAGAIGEAKAAAKEKPKTVDDYMSAMTSSKDEAMVNAGVVSVDGAKSRATTQAENILQQKGLPPDMAQETAANMTATERDNFIAANMEQPKASVPTMEPPVKASDIPDHIKAQLLPDEPPPTGNPDSDIIKGQNAAVNAANPAIVPEEQSSFNQLFKKAKEDWLPSMYAELFNDIQPIENLTKTARAAGAEVPEGSDTRLMASFAKSTPAWIERNWMSNTTEFDANGNQVVTGKGLKTIRDEFDTVLAKTEQDWKARQDDMNAFRRAMTFIEDKEKNLSNVSPRDLEDSSASLRRLADKYGNDFSMFEPFAKQEVAWNNRILHNLVSSGLKSQEWYDDITSQRKWYSPTQRVVEQEFPDLVASRALGRDVTPSRIGALMQRKGSSLDVKDTFQSQLRNSAIILQKSAHNKLRMDIAKYADYYPDEVKVSAPAIVREAVQHSFDPKLREKLEQTAKFLGGEVNRAKAGGEKYEQLKGNLGAYEPATKTTYLKEGTTEGTLTHEIGHMLDYTLDLKKRMLGNPAIKEELQNLAENRLRAKVTLQKTPEGMTQFAEQLERAPKSYMKYLKNDDEVLANFFDAWVNSPELVDRIAPKARAVFEKMIDDNPQLAMLRDIEPSTSRGMETIQRELLDQRGPKGSIPFYQNGRRMYLELDKELQKAFSTMTPMEIGMVERFAGSILGATTKVLKAGATSLPEFMLKHFYRAVFTSFLNNPAEKGMIGFMRHVGVRLPQGIFAVLGKNELYRQWASSSGALRTFMDLGDKSLAKVQKEMFDKGNMGAYLNPINLVKLAGKGYASAKEISDYAPRIAVFKSMKEAGHSDLEAGLASLEATGNYIRHGSLVNRINKSAPFFNDMVQGGDRFIRSQMRNPAAFMVKAISTVLIPQMMITGYYLYAADDQTRHDYLNILDFDRSIAMTVKIGDTWTKLPRAFAPGFVYGALTEKAMVWMYSKNHDDAPKMKDFWLKTLGEAATSVSPAFDWTRAITPLFKSWMESTMNYNLFMQRPLFTGDKTKVAPADQTNQYTTEVAKLVGKMLDISPINIDNTVYDMAGKAGRYGEQLTDMAINAARKAAGQPVNERESRPSDSPLYGGLVMDTPRGTNSQSYQEFLGNLHDAEQAYNHLKQLTGPDIAEYQKDNHQLLSAYQSINKVNSEVNELQKQIRNINKDTNLPGHDKTVQINHLQDTIGQIVEGANKSFRAATGGSQ